VVTFSIVRFMDHFLVPYKLGVISRFMMLFAAGSMAGWPLYRLGKNLYKRGRIPDMKRARVTITATVAGLVILALLLVPLPVSRVRDTAGGELEHQAVARKDGGDPRIPEKTPRKDREARDASAELQEMRSR